VLAENQDLGPQGRRETIIAKGEHEEAASRIFDQLTRPGRITLPSGGWSDQLLDLLQGTGEQPSVIEQRVVQRLRHVEQLTTAQSTILDLLRNTPRMEIVGGAGTGKTWLAMEQAKRWANEGLRVAFLTYTRGLSEMVAKAMTELPITEQPQFVGTFHYLGFLWGVTPTQEQEHNEDYWNNTAPQLYLDKAEALKPTEKFDAIVVDEAQDFAASWWPVIQSAVNDQSNIRIAIFRDDAQDVFEGRHARPDIDLATFPLDDNLRNARQVVETFAPLTENTTTVRGGEGFPTRIVLTESDNVIEAADDAVSQLVDVEGWLPEHVALLTTRNRHPVHAEQFAQSKETYWKDLWDTDDVFYGTVRGFKGLERPAVVIAINGFPSNINPKHLVYTAITRATDLVILVGTEADLESVFGEDHLRRLIKAQ
jgi:ATP:corrinoid adenosyltransferase